MRFKANYFLRNMVDLGIATLGEYLKSADQNYVILYKGEPNIWGDDTPVIYGDEAGVIAELSEQGAWNGDNSSLKEGWEVLTEFDFLVKYCKRAILNEIFKNINDKEFADFLSQKYNLEIITNTLSKK